MKQLHSLRSLLLLVTLGIFVSLAKPAEGGTRTWMGVVSNNWSQPDNWNPAGPLTNGDTVVFPAGKNSINDIANVSLFSIQFTGSGSARISGNPVFLDSDITADNNNGEARVILDVHFNSGGGTFYTLGSGDLRVDGDVYAGNGEEFILYANTTNITVGGSIFGDADLVKLGSGAAYFTGSTSNDYTGGTFIENGELYLTKSNNMIAISPTLTVGTSSSPGALLEDDGIGQYPGAMTVTMWNSGTWNINDSATVSSLTLTNGGAISGNGTLNLQCDVNADFAEFNNSVGNIDCAINLGSQTRTFFLNSPNSDSFDAVENGLSLGPINGTGSAGIVEEGQGFLALGSPSSYAGLTQIKGGELDVYNDNALGSSPEVCVSWSCILGLVDVTISNPVVLTNGRIFFEGSNCLNAPLTITNQFSDFETSGFLFADYGGDFLLINGDITGVGPIEVSGGTARFGGSDPNTFSGGAFVGTVGRPATLELAKPAYVTAVPGTIEVANTDIYDTSNIMTLRNLQQGGVQGVQLGHGAAWSLNGNIVAPQSLTIFGDATINTGGGQLQMANGVSEFGPGTNQFFVLNTSPFYPFTNLSFTAQIIGSLACIAPINNLIVSNGDTLNVSAQISGFGTLAIDGSGTVILGGAGNNTYGGYTVVSNGTLEMGKSQNVTAVPGNLILGPAPTGASAVARFDQTGEMGSGTVATINANSLLDLNGNNQNFSQLNLNDGGSVQTEAGSLQLISGAVVTVGTQSFGVPPASCSISGNIALPPNLPVTFNVNPYTSSESIPELIVSANIPRPTENPNLVPAAINKNGEGQMVLSGNNTFAGYVQVNNGMLTAASSSALGTADNGTYLYNDGTLVLDGGIDITSEPLQIYSTNTAALESRTGSNYFGGTIALNGPTGINVTTANGNLQALGAVSGTGGLTKLGPGTVQFWGFVANTYSGLTTVAQGTLEVGRVGLTAVPGDVMVGDDSTSTTTAILRTDRDQQFSTTANIAVHGSGLFDIYPFPGVPAPQPAIASLTGAGKVNIGTGTQLFVNNAATDVFPGLISGAGNFNKGGTGLFQLTANNTYTGSTTVGRGTLQVDGYQPGSPVTVGGTLQGVGTVGTVNATGNSEIVAPGEPLGVLTCGNFSADHGSMNFQLFGTSTGMGNNQLNVNGTVTLGSTLKLNATLNSYSWLSNTFTIIKNNSGNPVSGTFNGLAEGATTTIGSQQFKISYVGGDGNDVVLTQISGQPLPTLSLTEISTNSIELVWRTNNPPFRLEYSTNLATTNWTAATPLPVVVGTNDVVTNSIAGLQKFYRLITP